MKKNLISLAIIALFWSCGNPENEPQPQVPKGNPADENKISQIVAVGKVEPENEIVNLASQSGGMVRAVLKKDGDMVSQGELLVQLDDDLEQSKINEINMQIRSQRAQIKIEQTQFMESEINLANKKSLLEKTQRLVESGAETEQSLEDLSTEVKVLEVTLDRLRAKIQFASSQLEELSAQLKSAETEARKKQFKAPNDGIVLDMQVNPGEAVSQFSTFAEFAPQGKLMVRAEVDELFSTQVKAGQKVEILNTGSDQVLAVGELVLVSPYLKKKSLFSEKADDQEDRRVREIRIALKDANGLIINSKVECKIIL